MSSDPMTVELGELRLDQAGEREFAELVWERARKRDGFRIDPPLPDNAWLAGLHYLTIKVDRRDIKPSEIVDQYGVSRGEASVAAMRLRVAADYRKLLIELERAALGLEEPAEIEEPEQPEQGDEPPEADAPPEETPGEPVSGPDLGALPETDAPTDWRFEGSLFGWQEQCAREWWDRGGRGIAKIVTGAGKTLLALYLLAQLRDRVQADGERLQAFIVVPTHALLDQWIEEIRTHLAIPPTLVGEYHGQHKDDLDATEVLVTTSSSARDLLPYYQPDGRTFLIADECHRLGAPANSRVFNAQYDFTLGLSATPKRRGDFGFEEILEPELGPIIYRYGYAEAVRDGILCPFEITHFRTHLLTGEQEDYEALSEDLTKVRDTLLNRYPRLRHAQDHQFFQVLGAIHRDEEDPDIERFTALATTRKEILHGAENKFGALQEALGRYHRPGSRTLIFHERIENADQIYRKLREDRVLAERYHTGIPPGDRIGALARFRSGESEALVACRALDEGLDVPAIDLAVIVASTSSVRQHIQRFGRVLRRAEGKDWAHIVLIQIDGLEDGFFEDAEMEALEEAASDIRTEIYPAERSVPGPIARIRRTFFGGRMTSDEEKRVQNRNTPDGNPMYGDWYNG